MTRYNIGPHNTEGTEAFKKSNGGEKREKKIIKKKKN